MFSLTAIFFSSACAERSNAPRIFARVGCGALAAPHTHLDQDPCSSVERDELVPDAGGVPEVTMYAEMLTPVTFAAPAGAPRRGAWLRTGRAAPTPSGESRTS